MLTSLCPVSIPSQHTMSSHFTPIHSSPLAPRHANLPSTAMLPQSSPPPRFAASPSFGYSLFSPPPVVNTGCRPATETANGHRNESRDPSSRSRTSQTYAQRYSTQVSNPLHSISRSFSTSSSTAARAKRRDLFLNRIKQDRDADRLELRGEQLMRMEHLAEQKRWNDMMRKNADSLIPPEVDNWDEDEMQEEVGFDVEDDDDMLPDDERDLFALDADISQGPVMQTASSAGDRTRFDHQQLPQKQIWQHEHQGPQHNMPLPSDTNSSFYSDDEYDAIFTNLADPIEHSQDMDMAL